jgi:hypothetical protein
VSQIKGPAIFLAQFAQDVPPYNTLPAITQWVKDLGYIGVQIPGWDSHFIDLDKAAASKQYCDDLQGQTNGLEITEIATHLIGQLVAVNPALDILFDGFAPSALHNNPQARTEWARSDDQGHQGVEKPGPERPPNIFWCVALAYYVSLAAAASRTGRDGL